jgi:hypothetical protein
MFLCLGASATAVLFATDAFFAFAGWKILIRKQTRGRELFLKVHAFTEKREPFLAAIAMLSAVGIAAFPGAGHPRAGCLAGGAVMALAAHLLLHLRTACLVRGFEEAPIGSGEWRTRAGKLEAAMVTRASLQGAAFICIVAAGICGS